MSMTSWTTATGKIVAPFTGAWIEIDLQAATSISGGSVAPFTGAWIEIAIWPIAGSTASRSHPSRVRGLKSGG